jgi:hypothetical protein
MQITIHCNIHSIMLTWLTELQTVFDTGTPVARFVDHSIKYKTKCTQISTCRWEYSSMRSTVAFCLFNFLDSQGFLWQRNMQRKKNINGMFWQAFLFDRSACKIVKHHVPPFSGTCSLTASFANRVSTIGMTISSVSLWPFPGIWLCFLILGFDFVFCFISMTFGGVIHLLVTLVLIVQVCLSYSSSCPSPYTLSELKSWTPSYCKYYVMVVYLY